MTSTREKRYFPEGADWLTYTALESAQISREVEEAGEPDKCHVCGKTSFHDRAGYGFQVRECMRCQKNVCESHAETDYDLQGDPGSYVCTQWVCEGGCKEVG